MVATVRVEVAEVVDELSVTEEALSEQSAELGQPVTDKLTVPV